jgi:hypothetical protein
MILHKRELRQARSDEDLAHDRARDNPTEANKRAAVAATEERRRLEDFWKGSR